MRRMTVMLFCQVQNMGSKARVFANVQRGKVRY